MNEIEITDTATITDAVRKTSDGYLVANARVARSGVQEYMGSEMGRPDIPLIRLYRPPEVVFAEDAMRSYAYRPITSDHKATITAKNWREHAAGSTGAEVIRDGEFVRVPMVIMDQAVIDEYEAGKKELSMGLKASVEFIDGVTPEGEQYNAVVRQMKMNHLALVDKARGGESLRIGDNAGRPGAKNGAAPNQGVKKMENETVIVDGIGHTMPAQAAQVVRAMQQRLNDAKTAMDAEIGKLKAALDKATAERDDAQSKVLTDAQIDARVAERATLIADAKTLHDADYAGMSPENIRATVVRAKIGDAAVTGKSADYIAARYDMLREARATAPAADPMRTALQDAARRAPNPNAAADPNGQKAYVANLQNRWQTGGAAQA